VAQSCTLTEAAKGSIKTNPDNFFKYTRAFCPFPMQPAQTSLKGVKSSRLNTCPRYYFGTRMSMQNILYRNGLNLYIPDGVSLARSPIT